MKNGKWKLGNVSFHYWDGSIPKSNNPEAVGVLSPFGFADLDSGTQMGVDSLLAIYRCQLSVVSLIEVVTYCKRCN
jgi:hypothetical protein